MLENREIHVVDDIGYVPVVLNLFFPFSFAADNSQFSIFNNSLIKNCTK